MKILVVFGLNIALLICLLTCTPPKTAARSKF